MHVYYFESLLNGCADGMLYVLHHPQVVPRGMDGNRNFFVHAMLLQCRRGINPEPVRDLSQFVLIFLESI